MDEVFQRTDSGGASAFLSDALGSTLALTDSSGGLQTQYTYEPFGNTTTAGTSNSNSFQYTGRENDGTGLYYYRARYYSPAFGRFISEDPIGYAGGINFYVYVMNDPANKADPFGLDCRTVWVFIVCKFENWELPTRRRAQYQHERQHRQDNVVDPFHWHRSCEEKERRGFEREVEFLRRRIQELSGRYDLTDKEEADLSQAEQMLSEDEEYFKQPNGFHDYCEFSKGR